MTRLTAEELIAALERDGRPVPAALRDPAPDTRPARGRAEATEPEVTAVTFGVILDRVDARIGRREASDTEVLVGQAFATAWAALGYALWVTLVTLTRALGWTWRLVTPPWRRR